MRKFFTLKCLLLSAVFMLAGFTSFSQANHIVISQVYGGGGNSGAQYQNDFVELYNPTGAAVSINGWSIQYASSGGTTWSSVAALAGTIPSGGYYLIKLASNAAVGAALPTPDLTNTGINMSGTSGKVALSNSTTPFPSSCPIGNSALVDFVGFGTAANCSEGSPTATLSNTTAAIRKSNGCTETDVNSADFATGVPNPRNSASAANFCATPASVSTTTATAITTTTASSGGNVTSEGSSPVTARGIVWGTATAPTIALATKTTDGSGAGTFTSNLSGLTANTKYFYRAYATSSITTSYGTELSFVTIPDAPVMGTASLPLPNGFTAGWAAPLVGGTQTFTYTLEVDDDMAFGSVNATIPNIASGTTSFAITGLTPSTIYYYRVKAVNATGSSAYSTASAGIQTAAPATPVLTIASPLTGFGNVCLNTITSANSFTLNGTDLDGSNISIAALPGFSFSETPGGVYTSTLSFTTATNFSGKVIYVKFTPTLVQSYDGNINISGGGVAGLLVPVTANGINTQPSVATVSNTVSGTSATVNGSISSIGCSAVSVYGFEYSTVAGFANGTGIQITASNLGSGVFSKTISGLTANVTYYVKAFATNNGGTAYGVQQSFTTSSIVPVVIANQPLFRFTENFNDITNWAANFTSGVGASHFGSVATNASGTIPDGIKITTASSSFSTGTSGGVQKGTGNIMLLSTGSSPENSSSVAIDFYMDFTGVNAGTVSFDWASVNNSTGDRKGSLRVYATTDGINFIELTSAAVLNFTNNVPSTGIVNSIPLPASFNNSSTARLRFYYANGTGGTTGSRPKISIDNLIVTGIASLPCATPAAAPTSLTFGTITETSIQGSFVAASPAPNEYLVVMSTNSSLTSNPIDGQTYEVGDNLGDGTVIAKGSELNFTATDLTGATTYYFFVFPVNSVCTGGPKYLTTDPLTEDATTVAGLPSCTAPVAQPTGLVTNASINSIQGSFTATAADEYLVLQSTSASLSNLPVNGVVYNAGAALGNATVVMRGTGNSFTASGLNPATQYYYYVFSINSQACVNGPVYNTVSPLSGSTTTLPLPVCVTPSAQPANISFNSSNNSITATFNGAGSGYNYLVVMSSSPTLSGTPVDNTDYAVGSSLGGGTVISNNTATSFIATSLNNSTTYYFFVFSANKNCTGGTKYLITSPLTGNATTTNAPVNNYYFGTLHAHSDYSDGNKDHPGFTPGDDYNYASASLGMDFLGISEHNHFSSLDNPGNELANYHLGIAQAAAFNATHSNFLALYGMEWGVISGGGHVVVYGDGMNDLFGWESNVNGHVGPNYDVYVPKSTYLGVEGLFKTINDYVAKNAFATLAHPSNTDYNNLSNIPYDQSADDAISGVAVESGPATSTNTTYSNPGSSMFYLWYFQKLLSKGYHVGPTIDHDNHNTTFGRTTPARTAVIAPALTQSAIIKAVRDMHFYATEDVDAKVDFTINTRIMGSIFEDRNAPSISVNLTDATTNTSGALIRLMFGIPGSNTLPVVLDSVFASSFSYVDNALANHTTGYYYIDITNAGKRIITSPIWYTRTCASSSDTTATACDSFNWYGTVYTASTTATKIFTTAGGCDSTVTLHLTINNSPSSATIAFVGSDTGCPGAGVALTATAVGGPIASYQWFKDGNLVATTVNGNYTAMETGSYSVKAINAGNCFAMSASINATITDNIAPVPVETDLPVISAQCSVSVTTTPTATDNCAGTIPGTTTDPLSYNTVGTHTIHWTYNDGNGNISTQEQTVIVCDATAPVITTSGNTSVNNDAGKCGAAVVVTATATDNCGVASTVGVRNDGLSLTDDYPVGVTTITWTSTDIHGNTSTASQTITVNDTQKPTITAPGEYGVVNDAGQCYATLFSTGTPVTADNCVVASVTNNHPSTQYPVGTTIVIWTVTDIHGNSDTAHQTITVIDNEMPVFSVSNLAVSNTPGICGANITLATPIVTDNCGVLSITNNHPSTLFPIGTTVVTWTATDIHGWVKTKTQTITVNDTEAPVALAQNVIVTLDASGTATVTAAQVNAGSTDNCGISSYSLNKTNFNCLNVGSNTVILTVTDASGNSNTATAIVTVNNSAPVYTAVPDQTFCTNTSGTYSIPVFGASNSCGVLPITYTITGATTRSGSGNNASGSFAAGVSTIKWMQGTTVVGTTKVTISALPSVTITTSNADAFCNKLILTANSTVSGVTYKWMSGSSVFSNDAEVSLGQSNGDGIYTVTVSTAGGCTSAAAMYNYQKQNLVSSYTILATTKIDLGVNNKVGSGSVGVTAANGKVDFDNNSSVSSPGSFVKAKSIDKQGTNIIISNPIYSAATGITLPTMYSNTASTNGLSNKDVAQNSVSTVNGNYKNLTLKKGSRTTVTGNVFGTIRVEQGAQVTFTASTISIEKLEVVKGPRYGYSYVRFANDTKLLISGSVTIGSQVYINPDNKKVTFYMGDKKNDDERFTIKGGDTKVTANIYLPDGTLNVTGGYSYGDYGNGWGDCDKDDDEEKYYGKGDSYVTMTGIFIAEQVVGNGKNVNWNSFDCSAAPVPVLNSTIVTQMINASKETTVSETEEIMKVTVMPNPSTTYFTLKIASRDASPVNLRVLDASGRVVDTKSKLGANSTIQIGRDYSSGTYYAEMIQGANRKVVQLIKGRG